MRKPIILVVWAAVAVLGAFSLGLIALHRGETINAEWLVTAAVCTYAVAYRFYSRFLARRVFGLDDRRATPRAKSWSARSPVSTGCLLRASAEILCRATALSQK